MDFSALRKKPISADSLPAQEKILLDSCDPFTPRLEKARNEPMALEVLTQSIQDHILRRHILLRGSRTQMAASCGWVEIDLSTVPPDVSELIAQGRTSLGTLLLSKNLSFTSTPLRFFEISADDHLRNLAGKLPSEATLYGRETELKFIRGVVLGKASEIIFPELLALPLPFP